MPSLVPHSLVRGRSDSAVVVGSGPNGLAAAITLARAGQSVVVLEAEKQIGGGCQSAELTLPGFLHDVCSAVHPLALGSPFFRSAPLATYGVEWIQPPIPLAHPLDDGTAVALQRSPDQTADQFADHDRARYRALLRPFVERWEDLVDGILGPLRLPRHPILLARFGWSAIRSAVSLARGQFDEPRAQALFGGLAAHSMLPLDELGTAGFALVLAVLGHAVGWPIARGGSQTIADALTAYLRSLGGDIRTGSRVETLDDLPRAANVLFDVTPRQLVGIAGSALPSGYRQQLENYRYGPGVFKVDWALDRPIPWRAPDCRRAGTVHLGGTLDEIAAAERAVWRGENPARPFVILTQPSLFDPTRAPAGKHTAWAYCHVPNGSTVDVTKYIENQIERFAPGFREGILARSTMSPAALERHNANYVGGDINGGSQDLRQLFTRPTFSWNPYTTPRPGLYLCSSSTPPGGGVHGMCGYYAATAALIQLPHWRRLTTGL